MSHSRKSTLLAVLLVCCCIPAAYPVDLGHFITISSTEEFELLHGGEVAFKFQPLSSKAQALEITKDASALGVIHLGQLLLRENSTTLAALRSIANQIGKSLELRFGVITDSTTSDVLKESKQLLLYHPDITITLTLIKPVEQEHYEIVCTYAVRETKTRTPELIGDTQPVQAAASTEPAPPAAPAGTPTRQN